MPGRIDSFEFDVAGQELSGGDANKAGGGGGAKGSVGSVFRLLPAVMPAKLELADDLTSNDGSALTSKSFVSQSHVEATFETFEDRFSQQESSNEVRTTKTSMDHSRPSADTNTDGSGRLWDRYDGVSRGVADPTALRRELDNIKLELGAASQFQTPSSFPSTCLMSPRCVGQISS